MNNFLRLIIGGVLILFALIGAYFIGHKMGEDKTKTTLINNTETIKQIAELSSLEVNGVSEINITNTQDGSMLSTLSNFFFENSVNLRIPYTAKYGVDLQNIKVNVSYTDTTLAIYLPKAKLLSYELKLDKALVLGKTGWLVMEDYHFLQQAQHQLYAKSRNEMANNTQHIEAAQLNIAKTLTSYFHPFGFKVILYFDKKSIQIDTLKSLKS